MTFPNLDRVRRWRDHLRSVDPSPCRPLSDAGLRAAWSVALDALDDSALEQVAAIDGAPFATAGMAVARNVLTAPIEWCAVLLGRGTRLVLKHPHDEPGLVPLLAETAAAAGLPLTSSSDRRALNGVELVVAMGSDETVEQVRADHPNSEVLAFGHRFSVAWITRPESLAGLALDAALHDGRGCMSPVAVATPCPDLYDRLATELALAEDRLPRGEITADEAARLRARRALALAAGVVREGRRWSVHGLPAEQLVPIGLPRSLAVYPIPDAEAFHRWLAPWASAVSTVATDDPDLRFPGARLVAPGAMQRPPLLRLHDGVDWLRATLK